MSSFRASPSGRENENQKFKKLPSRVIFKKKIRKSRFFVSSLALALALFPKHNFGTEREQAQEQVLKKKNRNVVSLALALALALALFPKHPIECLRLGRRVGDRQSCKLVVSANDCLESGRSNISKRRTVAVHPQPSWGWP